MARGAETPRGARRAPARPGNDRAVSLGVVAPGLAPRTGRHRRARPELAGDRVAALPWALSSLAALRPHRARYAAADRPGARRAAAGARPYGGRGALAGGRAQ